MTGCLERLLTIVGDPAESCARLSRKRRLLPREPAHSSTWFGVPQGPFTASSQAMKSVVTSSRFNSLKTSCRAPPYT